MKDSPRLGKFVLLGTWPFPKEVDFLFMSPGHRRQFRELFALPFPEKISVFRKGDYSVYINHSQRRRLFAEIVRQCSWWQLQGLRREFRKSLHLPRTVENLERLAAFNSWANEVSFALESKLFLVLPALERSRLFEASTRVIRRVHLKDPRLDLWAQCLSFGASVKQQTEQPLVFLSRRVVRQIRRQLGPLDRQNVWISTESGLGAFEGSVPVVSHQVKRREGLRGFPANLGVARGRARVARSLAEAKRIRTGEILVCLTTEVHYEPYMAKAAAFVTELGGITSHAAIIAREQRKPCVVSVAGATRHIHTGDVIDVDATAGTVRIRRR